MSISMYSASVPVFVRMLGNLQNWLDKAQAHAEARKFDSINFVGLRLAPDYTLNEDELNTYACPWHNNLTAAVCSFRTAKALRTNPGSRHAIPTFHWHNSVSFAWHSQQLLDLGLIEPGQWF